MKHLFWAVVIMAALPLGSASAENGEVVLWDKVENGMTREKVQELYPEKKGQVKHKKKQTEIEDVVILEGCEAEVEIHHKEGFVDVVKVKGRGSIAGRCSDKVFAALGVKYGQPAVERKATGNILERRGRVTVWNSDGVILRFKRFTSGAFGGGGLGASSWEVWYTAAAKEIAL